jgi:uncharacterized protein (UPF0332 family)
VTETAAGLMEKVRRALASAEILLKDGDADGACNRAYYGMHDAARALLLHADADLPKTHSGLVTAFGLVIVGQGMIEKKFGAALNRVQRIRQIADYTGDGVSVAGAEAAVTTALEFVRRVMGVISGE